MVYASRVIKTLARFGGGKISFTSRFTEDLMEEQVLTLRISENLWSLFTSPSYLSPHFHRSSCHIVSIP